MEPYLWCCSSVYERQSFQNDVEDISFQSIVETISLWMSEVSKTAAEELSFGLLQLLPPPLNSLGGRTIYEEYVGLLRHQLKGQAQSISYPGYSLKMFVLEMIHGKKLLIDLTRYQQLEPRGSSKGI